MFFISFTSCLLDSENTLPCIDSYWMYQYLFVSCALGLFVFICHFECTQIYLRRSQKLCFFPPFDWGLFHFSDLCLENRSEIPTERRKAGDDFIVALFNVFSCMNSVPTALTLALEPYLEQARVWEHLHTLAGKIEVFSCHVFSIWTLFFIFI